MQLVNFSVMLEHLETKFVSFSPGEIKYDFGNSNNAEFMSELSNILNNALTVFPNSISYKRDDCNNDFFNQLKQ